MQRTKRCPKTMKASVDKTNACKDSSSFLATLSPSWSRESPAKNNAACLSRAPRQTTALLIYQAMRHRVPRKHKLPAARTPASLPVPCHHFLFEMKLGDNQDDETVWTRSETLASRALGTSRT